MSVNAMHDSLSDRSFAAIAFRIPMMTPTIISSVNVHRASIYAFWYLRNIFIK